MRNAHRANSNQLLRYKDTFLMMRDSSFVTTMKSYRIIEYGKRK